MRQTSPLAFLLLQFVVACSPTVPNPAFCCVTESDCTAFEVDDLRPCDVGQTCAPTHLCVATECDTSADCNSADSPTCSFGLCVAGCAIDDDCLGIAGAPHCAADQTCAACTANAQCPADREICDVEARACRVCRADTECPSGVCLDADGVCANPQSLIFVRNDGVDFGECSQAEPCRTLTFALTRVGATRFVVRILGGNLDSLGSSTTITLTGDVIIDGSGTSLPTVATPTFRVVNATLEGVSIGGTNTNVDAIEVAPGGTLRLTRSELRNGQIEIKALGKLEINEASLRDATVNCDSGCSVSILKSSLARSSIDASGNLTFSGNRVDAAGAGTFRVSGNITIENNVFLDSVENRFSGLSFLILGDSGSPGKFRFNTVVNSSAVTSTIPSISCLDVEVTSNIFALNSTQPMTGGCIPSHSLFDTEGAAMAGQGSGNTSALVSAFFIDPIAGDLRLLPGSPAIGLGEVGPTTDLDGNPRPQPAGSQPDAGAFESPK